MQLIHREWREGKVRPIPGNPPHDRPVSRGNFSRSGEFATIPSPPPFSATAKNNTEAPNMRFQGMTESIGPIWSQNQKPLNLRVGYRLPWVGPRASVKGRDGRSASCPSSAMSSGRLFLDRVARQQSPSPLHRHPQNNTHSPEAQAKDDISTLLGRRHFYFALTEQKKPLPESNQQVYNLHPGRAFMALRGGTRECAIAAGSFG
jgi:hypothetical protein